MRNYGQVLGHASPTVMGAARAADIVAALAPPAKSGGGGGAAMVKAEEKRPSTTEAVVAFAPGVVGAAVGAMAWRKHWVLGGLTGHALASNAMGLYRGGKDRKRAIYNLAVEGSGIGGALYLNKHPFWGWVGGTLLGATVTSFFNDSPAFESRQGLMKMLGGK